MRFRKTALALFTAAIMTSGAFTSGVYAKTNKLNIGIDASSVGTRTSAAGVGTGAMPKLEEGQAMTVDMATERAINVSSSLKTLQDSIDVAEEAYDDVLFDGRNTNSFVEDVAYAVSRKQLTLQIQSYKDKYDITKEQIRHSVESYFSAIEAAQNSLAIYDENISLAKRKLDISKKQYDLGMMSQTAYDAEVDNYNAVIAGKASLQSTLDSQYAALNTLCEYNVAAVYPIEIEGWEYTPIDPVSLDKQVALATSSSNMNIRLLENNVEVAKYELDLHSDLYSTDTRLQKQAQLFSATSTLNDTKLKYEASVKTLFDNITVLEENHKTLTEQLTTLKNTMNVYEKQYELGQITELQLDNYRYNVKDLTNKIREAENQHHILTAQYENPNLLG